MLKITTAIVSASILLTGCATSGANFSPIVDVRNEQREAYSKDLSECQAFARQQAGAADRAAAGAIAGAVLGALIAAAAGGGYSRNSSAGVGAVTGLAQGAAAGERDQTNVIRRCLAGRGYSVLN